MTVLDQKLAHALGGAFSEIFALNGKSAGARILDRVAAAEFDESLHPRDETGKFSDSGGGGSDERPTFAGSVGEPVGFLVGAAAGYNEAHGLPAPAEKDWSSITADPALGHDVAADYRAQPDREEEALPAYKALADEVAQQYDYLTGPLGVTVQVVREDPYRNVDELRRDLTENHTLKVLATAATGSHPYFTDAQNDQFRAVHDAFGHAAIGRGFDRNGEEAAFQAHAQMFSERARPALATETRGQNSAMVYGDGTFPPQKVAVLDDPRMWAAALSSIRADAGGNPDDDNLYVETRCHHASLGRTLGGPRAAAAAAARVRERVAAAEFDESLHPRDDHGKFSESGGGGGSFEEAVAALPKPPGETPIPPGYVRLFHVTPERNVASIRKNGLQIGSSKGESYGEPSMVWATAGVGSQQAKRITEGGLADGDFAVVEFAVNPKDLDIGRDSTPQQLEARSSDVTLFRDVPPSEIVAVHEPWQDALRTIDEYGVADEIRAGDFKYLRDTSPGWAKAYDIVMGTHTAAFDPDQPRDDHGMWTDTGAGGASAVPEGASKDLTAALQDHAGTPDDPLACGGNVDLAAEALGHGLSVDLDQPDEVATLLDKLAAIADDAAAKGEQAGNYDLCGVSVEGTNVFCAENIGIPRAEMPQLKGFPVPGSPADAMQRSSSGQVDLSGQFIDSLRASGITVTDKVVDASHLRASQSQLVGTQVAGMIQAAEAGRLVLNAEPIFVTADGYILDGHHRWAATVGSEFSSGENLTMPVHELGMRIGEAIDRANAFSAQQGIAAKTAALRILARVAAAVWRAAFAEEDWERDHGRFARYVGDKADHTDEMHTALKAVSDQVAARAADVERSVSPDMRAVAAQHEGQLLGYGFRLKTVDSLERKIGDKVRDEGMTPEQAAASIKDSLRYTVGFNEDRYTDGVKGVTAELEKRGYQEVQAKNFWAKGDAYSGLNTFWRTPAGLTMEVQFHTPRSYQVKEDEIRDQYHEYRLASTPPERRRELFDDMAAHWDPVPVPVGAMSIGTPVFMGPE